MAREKRFDVNFLSKNYDFVLLDSSVIFNCLNNLNKPTGRDLCKINKEQTAFITNLQCKVENGLNNFYVTPLVMEEIIGGANKNYVASGDLEGAFALDRRSRRNNHTHVTQIKEFYRISYCGGERKKLSEAANLIRILEEKGNILDLSGDFSFEKNLNLFSYIKQGLSSGFSETDYKFLISGYTLYSRGSSCALVSNDMKGILQAWFRIFNKTFFNYKNRFSFFSSEGKPSSFKQAYPKKF